jgi:hypothetical protein
MKLERTARQRWTLDGTVDANGTSLETRRTPAAMWRKKS